MKLIIISLVFALLAHDAVSQTSDIKIYEDWVNDNLIELSQLNFNRIDRLDSILNERRIVGIGEPLHASKTINEVRISLSKYLIKNHSFNIVAAEMPFYAGLIVNNYVLDNKGSINDIIQVLGRHHFFNVCSEFIGFIEWIKDYNQNNNNKVQVFGFDIQMNLTLLNDITEMFSEIDNGFSNELVKTRQLIDKANGGWFLPDKPEENDYVMDVLKRALAKLDEYEEYITDFKLSKLKIEVLVYDLLWRNSSYAESFVIRAEFNSELIKWIVNKIHDSKAILLAHSGHLGKDYVLEPKIRTNKPDKFMDLIEKEGITGYHLDAHFGSDYYFIGLQFSNGTFKGYNPDNDYQIETLTVKPPSDNTLNWLLKNAKSNYFFIETKPAINMPREMFYYLTTFQSSYSIGAAYDYKYMKSILAEYYDAIVFIYEIFESEIITNYKK